MINKIKQYFIEENQAIVRLDLEKIEDIVASFKKAKKEGRILKYIILLYCF